MRAQSLELQEHGNKIAFMYKAQLFSNKELRQLLKTHKMFWVGIEKYNGETILPLLVAVRSASLMELLGRWTGGKTPNWTIAGIGVLGAGLDWCWTLTEKRSWVG